MMTDHYANMHAGSDSEQDINDGAEILKKPQKRARGTKFSEDTLGQDVSTSLPDSPDEGCLSLLKKRRYVSTPWSVGKRTPRVPVSFPSYKEDGENCISPARRLIRLKSSAHDNGDAREIALVLADALKRTGSQVSRTPNKKSLSYSPVEYEEQTQSESEMTSAKVQRHDVEEGACELSLGSTDAYVGSYCREKRYLKSKKPKINSEMEEIMNNYLDGIKEACSGTEEEQNFETCKEKLKTEDSNAKVSKASTKFLRKKSKKLYFGEDEDTPFQALQALADLSLRLPDTPADIGTSIDVNDEKVPPMVKSKSKANHSNSGLLKITKEDGNSVCEGHTNSKEMNGLHRRGNGIPKRRKKFLDAKIADEEIRHEANEKGNENDPEHCRLGELIKPTSC